MYLWNPPLRNKSGQHGGQQLYKTDCNNEIRYIISKGLTGSSLTHIPWILKITYVCDYSRVQSLKFCILPSNKLFDRSNGKCGRGSEVSIQRTSQPNWPWRDHVTVSAHDAQTELNPTILAPIDPYLPSTFQWLFILSGEQWTFKMDDMYS